MTETITRRGPWADVPRWLWGLTIGSLALNLIIAGTMLGQRLRPAHSLPPGMGNRLAQGASTPLIHELTPEKRTELRRIFETYRGQNRPLWQAVRERRAEVTKALEAEAFDKGAYVSAMARLIEAEAKARTAAQPTFAEVAAALSARERHDFLTNHRQLRQQLMAGPRDGATRAGTGGKEQPAEDRK